MGKYSLLLLSLVTALWSQESFSGNNIANSNLPSIEVNFDVLYSAIRKDKFNHIPILKENLILDSSLFIPKTKPNLFSDKEKIINEEDFKKTDIIKKSYIAEEFNMLEKRDENEKFDINEKLHTDEKLHVNEKTNETNNKTPDTLVIPENNTLYTDEDSLNSPIDLNPDLSKHNTSENKSDANLIKLKEEDNSIKTETKIKQDSKKPDNTTSKKSTPNDNSALEIKFLYSDVTLTKAEKDNIKNFVNNYNFLGKHISIKSYVSTDGRDLSLLRSISLKRALLVRESLVENGFDGSHISVHAMDPKDKNNVIHVDSVKIYIND